MASEKNNSNSRIVIFIILLATGLPVLLLIFKSSQNEPAQTETRHNPSENVSSAEAQTNPENLSSDTNSIQTDSSADQAPSKPAKIKQGEENQANLNSRLVLPRQKVTNEWVIVDCNSRVVIKCPHVLIPDKISPTFPKGPNDFLQGKCRDVSIGNFCGF